MKKIGIIGAGNIGGAIAKGLINHGNYSGEDIIISRRKRDLLENYHTLGINCSADNSLLVSSSELLILAVLPGQAREVLEKITPFLLTGRHILLVLFLL